MMDIQIDDRQATATIGYAGAHAMPNIVAAMGTIGRQLHRVAADKMGEGGILGVRTGTLRRALFDQVTQTGTAAAEVRIGVDLGKAPYGRIQELGGTITPKTAAHLAIPLEAMLTANGVARGTAREVIADPFAFGFSGTFTAKNVIFGKVGLPGSGVHEILPLFALKDSVTLPAREYLKSTFESQRDFILSTLQNAVSEATHGG